MNLGVYKSSAIITIDFIFCIVRFCGVNSLLFTYFFKELFFFIFLPALQNAEYVYEYKDKEYHYCNDSVVFVCFYLQTLKSR